MTTKSLSSLPQKHPRCSLKKTKSGLWCGIKFTFSDIAKNNCKSCVDTLQRWLGLDQLRRWLAIYPNIPQPIDLGRFFGTPSFQWFAWRTKKSTQASHMVGRLVDVSSRVSSTKLIHPSKKLDLWFPQTQSKAICWRFPLLNTTNLKRGRTGVRFCGIVWWDPMDSPRFTLHPREISHYQIIITETSTPRRINGWNIIMEAWKIIF